MRKARPANMIQKRIQIITLRNLDVLKLFHWHVLIVSILQWLWKWCVIIWSNTLVYLFLVFIVYKRCQNSLLLLYYAVWALGLIERLWNLGSLLKATAVKIFQMFDLILILWTRHLWRLSLHALAIENPDFVRVEIVEDILGVSMVYRLFETSGFVVADFGHGIVKVG